MVVVLVLVVVVVVVWGGGGVILGEVKARPKDIISFSLDYISKSKVQTSNPSSSPISTRHAGKAGGLIIHICTLLYFMLYFFCVYMYIYIYVYTITRTFSPTTWSVETILCQGFIFHFMICPDITHIDMCIHNCYFALQRNYC